MSEVFVYFDSINGNDSTGNINNINTPFKTITAGYNFAKNIVGPNVGLDLLLIQGSFIFETGTYSFFFLSDINKKSFVTIDPINTFSVAFFDTNLTIIIPPKGFYGINVDSFFQIESNNTLNIIDLDPSTSNFSDNVIFNGSVDSIINLYCNINTTTKYLQRLISTNGNIITTFPYGIAIYPLIGNITSTFDLITSGNAGSYVVIDNTTKLDGINSTLLLGASPNDGRKPITLNFVKVNNINTTVTITNSNINIQPANNPPSVTLTKIYFVNMSTNSINTNKNTIKNITFLNNKFINKNIKNSLVIQRIRRTAISKSIFTGDKENFEIFLTNSQSLATSLINLFEVELIDNGLTNIQENIDLLDTPLYNISSNFNSINYTGAFINKPTIITFDYTHSRYDGTLFFIDATNNDIKITLISDDDPGRIFTYKRIDKSTNKVVIKSPGTFENGCSKISVINKKCLGKGLIIAHLTLDQYYVI